MFKQIHSIGIIVCLDNTILISRISPQKRQYSGFSSCPFSYTQNDNVNLEETQSSLHELIFEKLRLERTHNFEKQVQELQWQEPNYTFQINKEKHFFTFYRFDIKTSAQLDFDQYEFKRADFIPIEKLKESFKAGKIILLPLFIQFLEEYITQKKALHLGHRIENLPFIDGIEFYFIPSKTIPPMHYTLSLLIGDTNNPKILVDPSPVNQDYFEEYIALLKQKQIDALLVTHQHPDHIQFSSQIAKELKVKIYITERTATILEERFSHFYKNNTLEYVKNGDVLTTWKGVNVKIIDLKGHASGLVGLITEDLQWCFAVDIVRSNGGILIPYPDGNMSDYFQSLKKIKKLQPKFIITSHDLPEHSVFSIKRTIEYRYNKEKEIRLLHLEGLSEEEIYTKLYGMLPNHLQEFALMMLKSHLKKIKDDITQLKQNRNLETNRIKNKEKNPYVTEIIKHKNNIIAYQDEIPINWHDHFQQKQPLIVDIGSGTGNFVIHQAQGQQDKNFIGIETQFKRIVKSSLKKEKQELKNVMFLQRKAEILDEFFLPESVDEVYIQFPDPWPKKRHHKNRLVNKDYLKKIHKVLVKNGQFIFRTDYKPYFDEVVELFNSDQPYFEISSIDANQFKNTNQEFMTEFETIFVQQGLPIHRIILTKKEK